MGWTILRGVVAFLVAMLVLLFVVMQFSAATALGAATVGIVLGLLVGLIAARRDYVTPVLVAGVLGAFGVLGWAFAAVESGADYQRDNAFFGVALLGSFVVAFVAVRLATNLARRLHTVRAP